MVYLVTAGGPGHRRNQQYLIGREAQGWSKRSPGLVTGSDHDQAHAALSQSSRKLESEAELEALVRPA